MSNECSDVSSIYHVTHSGIAESACDGLVTQHQILYSTGAPDRVKTCSGKRLGNFTGMQVLLSDLLASSAYFGYNGDC